MADKKAQWGRKAQDEPRPNPAEFVFGKQEATGGEGAAPMGDAPNNGGQQGSQNPSVSDAASGGSQSPSTGDVPSNGGQQDSQSPSAQEAMVRITVDVRKSIHKELQRVCNARELKIAQLIRQLIERELKKSNNRQ